MNFFVTNKVSFLKDGLESIQPFGGGRVDDVISKHKNKRNVRAIQVGREEEAKFFDVRNRACRHNTIKAFGIVNHCANHLLGQSVEEVHRMVVNYYPYGDTLVGMARQYSPANKQ